jgi:hypothetical protein
MIVVQRRCAVDGTGALYGMMGVCALRFFVARESCEFGKVIGDVPFRTAFVTVSTDLKMSIK